MNGRAPGEHRLRLEWRDGRRDTVVASSNQTVLEAAEAAEVALPFGCRTGACATCTGRLFEGAIEYRRPPRALKADHRSDGYVLTCVAEARDDCRIEVGSKVATDLVSNPWEG